MRLDSPSASVAGEGGWEKRGTQTLHFGSHRLEPAWYQSPKGKGEPRGPKSYIDGMAVPCGGRVSPLGPFPEP